MQRQEFLQRTEASNFIDFEGTPENAAETINFLEEIHFEDYAFAVTFPIPWGEAEWRAVVRDPSKFTAKKMAKGVEVSWQKLNEQQRSAMKEAKQPSRSRSMSGSILRCAKLLWGVYQLQDSCRCDDCSHFRPLITQIQSRPRPDLSSWDA